MNSLPQNNVPDGKSFEEKVYTMRKPQQIRPDYPQAPVSQPDTPPVQNVPNNMYRPPMQNVPNNLYRPPVQNEPNNVYRPPVQNIPNNMLPYMFIILYLLRHSYSCAVRLAFPCRNNHHGNQLYIGSYRKHADDRRSLYGLFAYRFLRI